MFPPQSLALDAPLVERPIRESIGFAVELAWNVNELKAIETAAKGIEPLVMPHEGQITDAIDAIELADYELRIHAQLDACCAQRYRGLDGGDCRLIFRLVVGPAPDCSRDLRERFAIVSEHNRSDRRRTRVAP
jgi:hypothetical protein